MNTPDTTTALEPTSTPVHLGDVILGDLAPACGASNGEYIAIEDSAVTCPQCIALLPYPQIEVAE